MMLSVYSNCYCFNFDLSKTYVKKISLSSVVVISVCFLFLLCVNLFRRGLEKIHEMV